MIRKGLLLTFTILLSIFGISAVNAEIIVPDTSKFIDYTKYFSPYILRQGYSDNTPNEWLRKHNAPFLKIGTIVPNGGGLRTFTSKKIDKSADEDLWDVFEESPYQDCAPMQYMRYCWCQLEDNEGNYLFDDVLEPVLKNCVDNHQRFTIGFLINSYSIKGVYAGYTKDTDGSIRKYTVPKYIFDRMQHSEHPMIKDDQYAKWWSANMDSPYLYSRYEAFVRALDKWLEGNVKGSKIKRRDVIFGIEERYLGYWGEGGLAANTLPQTNIIESYHNLLVATFKDKILVAPGQLMNHLPKHKSSYSKAERVVMHCVYNMLSRGTDVAKTGLFRDSWKPYDDRYDIVSQRMMIDDSGRTVKIVDYLRDNTFRDGYTTGEFGFNTDIEKYGLVPYQHLYDSFQRMRMNGISLHNYTIYEGSINNEFPYQFDPYGIHQQVRDILSVTGYRIVMNTSHIEKQSDGSFVVKVLFSNIGVAPVVGNYYRVHLLLKDGNKHVVMDYTTDFDIRSIKPLENLELGTYDPSHGQVFIYKIPALANNAGTTGLYLCIIDEKGIEYPMTLSNYGRSMEKDGGDGSYKLGILK